MKRRILQYLAYVDGLFERDDIDWTVEKQKHLVQIGFFAHERLVHLIVTVVFAIMTLISIFYLNMTENPIMILLVFAFLILLIPYIKHYYLLENSVQRMYEQYDKMCKAAGDEAFHVR